VKVQVSRSVLTPQVTALGERLVTHAGLGMLAEVADWASPLSVEGLLLVV
jgi:hypothetical protein